MTQTRTPASRTGSGVQRRVRHDVAEGAAVMAFSLAASVAVAVVVALGLSVAGGLW